MEEIDAIIFFTLKGIGCEFSENETALTNMSQETFIKAIVMCLQNIQPTINLSHTIPRSMSARYQYGISVADACKKVGFKSDIGYQTILYGNVNDMRKILMFLIEKLPKETTDVLESKSKRYTMLKVLKEGLTSNKQKLNASILKNYPYVSEPLETGISVPGCIKDCTPAEWRNFCINNLKYITNQTSDLKYLIPSLITLNTNRLLGIYECGISKKISLKTEEKLSKVTSKIFRKEIENTLEKNIDCINSGSKILLTNGMNNQSKNSESSYIQELVSQNNELKNLILRQQTSNENLISKLEKLEKEKNVQEKSLNIIGNPEVISKLKNKVDASPEKIKKMNLKWSKYENEQKLILSELNDEITKKQANNNKLKSVYDTEKLKLQNIFEEIKKKEDIIKICRNDLESKTNYNSRSSYTQRILEIISNIEKQKKEINKNLNDTRLVQKEINSLDGKVGRCFVSIDELMFQVAKKDETIRKCYKLLAAIHSNSSSIIQSVKQTGTIGREIKDLEEQIENENPRQATTNIQKLKKDLEIVKSEQLLLLKKLEN